MGQQTAVAVGDIELDFTAFHLPHDNAAIEPFFDTAEAHPVVRGQTPLISSGPGFASVIFTAKNIIHNCY